MPKKEKLQKILGYGLIASSALAMTTNAQAAVHYSGPQNLVVDFTNSPVNVDLNDDGYVDFMFIWSSYWVYISYVTSGSIGGVSFIQNTYNADAARLPAGYSIKATLTQPSYYWSNENSDTLVSYSYYSNGNFYNKRGYIGVRFHSESCTDENFNYGWIQFEGIVENGSVSGRIIDWAYEDECNVPIKAGDKGESQANTPVPLFGGAGLAGLAALLGAAGVAGLRKREKEDKE